MPVFTQQFRAMGTEVGLWLWSDHESLARQALAQTEQFFNDVETRLSRFKSNSELSRLNQSAGQPFLASPLLFELVELALAWRERTNGIFDPAVLQALIDFGYDHSFEEMVGQTATETAPAPVSRPVQGQVRLNRVQRSISLPVGVSLDLGGLAKGWTVQRAAQQLGRFGPALVDAGGDIACIGAPPNGSPWLVGIADPHQPEVDLAALPLVDEAVATSSLARRRWQHHGRPAHHLIDPRTGAPALTDLSSVTVVAPSLPDAEIHAKVALILGAVEGLAYLEKQPDVSALLVATSGDLLSCGYFEDKAYVYSPAFATNFVALV